MRGRYITRMSPLPDYRLALYDALHGVDIMHFPPSMNDTAERVKELLNERNDNGQVDQGNE